MKPRFDLIKTDRLNPEDEAFGLDIAVYKNLRESAEFLKEDAGIKHLFSSLIFYPRDKV